MEQVAIVGKERKRCKNGGEWNTNKDNAVGSER
jgi:hypothetical protein